MAKTSFFQETLVYAQQAKRFDARDWVLYTSWVGLMFGLFAAVTSFLLVGVSAGVQFPAYVWNISLGAAIFAGAISFDTIGHRTIYRAEIEKGEGLVHQLTIAAGISSCLMLCLAYSSPVFWRIPALAMIALSFVYSAIDEVFHWRRYVTLKCDRVESWAHFFILVGHTIMILAWWTWFEAGYPGVAETLPHLPR